MTHYYRSASLHYSIFNIVIQWCVFYCLWNLWTLPRLEDANERVDFSMTIPGNKTILQESLPIRIINGRKTILVPQLWDRLTENADSESTTRTATSETKAPSAQLSTRTALKNTPNGKLMIEESRTRLPEGYQRLNRYQMTAKIARSQVHATSSENAFTSPTQAREPPSSLMPAVRRLRRSSIQSHPRHSVPITSQQQPRRSAMTLLVFGCAFASGGIFALRALQKIERWEIQSQEDNLAYDIAYTIKSEANYGSFESQSWRDDLSKYDV